MTAVLAGALAALAVLLARPAGGGVWRLGPVRREPPGRPGGRGSRPGRQRRRDHAPTGLPAMLVLDLVAAVLASGAAPDRALEVVAGALDCGADSAAGQLRAVRAALTLPDGQGPPAAAGRVGVLVPPLRMAASAGLPPAGLARAAASDLRRGRAAAQSRAAQRLAVLLVLPGGLCLLPAFMALGVAPLVIDLLLGAV